MDENLPFQKVGVFYLPESKGTPTGRRGVGALVDSGSRAPLSAQGGPRLDVGGVTAEGAGVEASRDRAEGV